MNEMNIKYRIKKDLSKYNDDELCEIYYTFNVWKWPPLLGEEPNWRGASPNYIHGFLRKTRTLRTNCGHLLKNMPH